MLKRLTGAAVLGLLAAGILYWRGLGGAVGASGPALVETEPADVGLATAEAAPPPSAGDARRVEAPPAAVPAPEDVERATQDLPAHGAVSGALFGPGQIPLPRNLVALVRTDRPERVARTDAYGEFRFDDVAAGEWTVAFQGDGGHGESGATRLGEVTVRSGETARVVVSVTGERRLVGNLPLGADGGDGYAVTLRLLDDADRLVASGMAANLDPLDGEARPAAPAPHQLPGYFEFAGLAPGRYRLEVRPMMSAPPDLTPLQLDEYWKPMTLQFDVEIGEADVELPFRRLSWQDDFHLRVE